jgi:flavin reductase (DIM6/NTAB) family NADH-FMN oxidoreductase RutF
MSQQNPELVDGLKNAMRLAPSSVSVVTAKDGDETNGLTATSFCSVSMEPPSLLVCVNQDSNTNGLIRKSNAFCVNLLSTDQVDASNAFSSSNSGEEKIENSNARLVELNGVPAIADCVANLVCEVTDTIESGTHTIFIGTVTHAEVADDKEPLLYGLQAYGKFTDQT